MVNYLYHREYRAQCDFCGEIFEAAQPFTNAPPLWGSSITLSGGYAEFWDYGGEPDISKFELTLCHDCTLPLFRKVMASAKYAHLKMDFFNRSHQYEDTECCEYAYNVHDAPISDA